MAARGSGGFVGRASEVRLLRSLLAGVVAGRGGAVLVEGEPGIGKSALLAEGLAGAAERGCEVLWGVADELGQRFPLQVMVECLGVEVRSDEPRRAEIARLLQGEGLGAGAVASRGTDPLVAAVERLLALVDVLCAQAPVLLVVDDLQWADEASLLLFHRLSHAVDQLPLLLVGAGRPVPRREELEQLRRGLLARDASVLSLAPLPPHEVNALVGSLAGAPAGPALRRRAERAAGNPLYVREVVDALIREDAVRVEAGVAEVMRQPSGAGSPASLSAAIANRLGFLSREAREVLRSAALLGIEFSVADLGVVAGRPASLLIGVVDEAVAAGVVEPSGALLRFRHALIRQALYESMPPALRSALHRQAAQALADAGAPAERVAQQLLPVVETPDAWMLDWLVRSAPVLICRAPQIVAELLARVIEHAPVDDPRQDDLEGSLAAVTFLLARHDQVERCAGRVLARTRDPERAAEMTWILAYARMRTARAAEGIAALRDALAGPTLTPVWAARLRSLLGLILVHSGRYEAGGVAARQALVEAERVGDRFATGYANQVLCYVAARRRDHAARLDFAERGLAGLGEDPATADLRVVLLVNKLTALIDADRIAEADRTLGEARLLAERLGSARGGFVHVVAGVFYFMTGRWDDALAELESVVELPDTIYVPLLQHGVAAIVAAHRDDWAATRASLGLVDDRLLVAGAGRTNGVFVLRAQALLAERDAGPRAALAVLAPTLHPDYAEDVDDIYLWLPGTVRLALAVGDLDTAGAATAAAATEASRHRLPVATAAAGWCRGLLDGDPEAVSAAADHFRRTSRPLELAQALEDTAVVLARQARLDAARAAYTEAVEVYTTLGADWDIARADARVRPLGIRRGPRGPRRRATVGWDALSPTEVKVAHLVAQGLSNPEIGARLFLSRRTVQTHVSHIMTKLGGRSRTEVAREAALHPAAPGTPDYATDHG